MTISLGVSVILFAAIIACIILFNTWRAKRAKRREGEQYMELIQTSTACFICRPHFACHVGAAMRTARTEATV